MGTCEWVVATCTLVQDFSPAISKRCNFSGGFVRGRTRLALRAPIVGQGACVTQPCSSRSYDCLCDPPRVADTRGATWVTRRRPVLSQGERTLHSGETPALRAGRRGDFPPSED